jgi:hypothetical protein
MTFFFIVKLLSRNGIEFKRAKGLAEETREREQSASDSGSASANRLQDRGPRADKCGCANGNTACGPRPDKCGGDGGAQAGREPTSVVVMVVLKGDFYILATQVSIERQH